MTHTKPATKSVTINHVNYSFRVQSYNYFNRINNSLNLVTTIEIIENGQLIVGCLQGYSNLSNSVPLVAKMDEKVYHEKKRKYHEREGRKLAEEYLQKLTEAQLTEAIQYAFSNCN